MRDDEAEIRELVTTWMAATKAGDAQAVLDLMTDDVVFLVPGQAALRIDGKSDIEEIQVCGDWAFMRSHLTVRVTPPAGETMVRAGYALTVLRRENGRWKLARDANLVGPA
jgi:ketosteroid isomerase-like protein